MHFPGVSLTLKSSLGDDPQGLNVTSSTPDSSDCWGGANATVTGGILRRGCHLPAFSPKLFPWRDHHIHTLALRDLTARMRLIEHCHIGDQVEP